MKKFKHLSSMCMGSVIEVEYLLLLLLKMSKMSSYTQIYN